MAIKRFCDWCEKEIEHIDPYFYVGLSPTEKSAYRGSLQKKSNYEICNKCMSKVMQFIRDIKDENG